MPETSNSNKPHHVVIIGGGFGGLNAAKALKHAPVEITLVDQRNFHLFQPLLYQVAGGALSPANIASPLRQVFAHQKNCQVLLGKVLDIDPVAQRVVMNDDELTYDSLIVAAGSTHSYFGNDHWEKLAPGLKTVEDATKMRSKILTAFEKAEVETDPDERRRLLTFVIVGGGPTGVELAGSLADISHRSLSHDFRNINPADARILIIEGAERLLMPFPPELSQKAEKSLERLGVIIRCNAMVKDIQANRVVVKEKDAESEETIATETVLWAAGVQAVPLGKVIAEATGAEIDRGGRITVEPDLSLPNYPNLFVIGDLAKYTHQGDSPLPGVAPVAMQEGSFVARLIDHRLRGKTLPKFHYHDKGNLATIGKWAAVADFGWMKISGFCAWVLWLFVHLLYITSFRNRILVLIQWGWNFIMNDRSARLITGTESAKVQQVEEPHDHTENGKSVPATEPEASAT